MPPVACSLSPAPAASCLLVRADGANGAAAAEEETLHQLLELRLGTDAQCAHCYAALSTVHADLAGARRALDRALADVEAKPPSSSTPRSLGLRDSVPATALAAADGERGARRRRLPRYGARLIEP